MLPEVTVVVLLKMALAAMLRFFGEEPALGGSEAVEPLRVG
jgi:hypothetical protein